MSEKVRYQVRFVTAGAALRDGTLLIMSGSQEYLKWRTYYHDQLARARLDPDLSYNQRKEVAAACKDFGWRPDRTLLIKEPIGDYRSDNPVQSRAEKVAKKGW